MSIGVLDITDLDFNEEVLECRLPVVACFTTKWCHSCYPTCLIADQFAAEYDGVVKFVRIDRDTHPELTVKYHLRVVPTIITFQDAQPVGRALGIQDRDSIRVIMDRLAAVSAASGLQDTS